MPWPVRILVGLIAGVLLWQATAGWRTTAPAPAQPCIALFDASGHQINAQTCTLIR